MAVPYCSEGNTDRNPPSQHPISPPQELRDRWLDEAPDNSVYDYLIDKSSQWGWDQRAPEIQAAEDAELEACIRHLDLRGHHSTVLNDLRAARRPKPPSAIEQAESLIERHEDGWVPSPAQWHVIREGLAEGRRALEALPDELESP